MAHENADPACDSTGKPARWSLVASVRLPVSRRSYRRGRSAWLQTMLPVAGDTGPGRLPASGRARVKGLVRSAALPGYRSHPPG